MAKVLLLVVLIALSGIALGQTACPGGVAPGDPRCGPSPSHQQPSIPPPNVPKWQHTWGAIASDETGVTGTTVGHFSRGEAKREALAQCASIGGQDCKVVLAYKNQCAVIADPVEGERAVAGMGVAQGGSTIEIAAQLAISSCSTENDGRECRIVYSDCTVPLLVN